MGTGEDRVGPAQSGDETASDGISHFRSHFRFITCSLFNPSYSRDLCSISFSAHFRVILPAYGGKHGNCATVGLINLSRSKDTSAPANAEAEVLERWLELSVTAELA
jgi:hypothetical protein